MHLLFSRLANLSATIVILSCFTAGASAGGSGTPATIASQKDLTSLLNWAVHLSRYEKPQLAPEVRFVDHSFLVRRACYGKECNVLGWYNDNNIVYIDQELASLDSMMQRSIVVHEMIHYLQHQAGSYGSSCKDSLLRESEAYEIQRQFFFAYGALSPILQKEFHCVDLPSVDLPEIDPESGQQLSSGDDF